jgi:DNA-binding MarR family transcriptional regulator
MAEAIHGRLRVAPRYTAGGGALHQLLREVERVAREGVGSARLSTGRLALLRSLGRAAKTASELARERGASRQSTLRIVESLLAEGWIARAPNPRHRRAPLLGLTPLGARVYERAALAQAEALNRLAERCDPAQVLDALRLLRSLRAPRD